MVALHFVALSGIGNLVLFGVGTVYPVIVWLASHVLPYLSLWVGCRL